MKGSGIKTSFSWLNKNLVGFGFASFLSDANHEIVPLVLPAFIATMVPAHDAPWYVGLISGLSTAAASISVLFSGWLSDRLANRKPLLLFGYGLTGILVGLLGYAHSWATVLILMTIAWFGRGMRSAPRDSLIADSLDPAYYGHAFGFRQALDTAGAVTGPLMVYILAGHSFSTIFFVSLIPGVLSFLTVALFIHEVPRRQQITKAPSGIGSLPPRFYYFLIILFIFGLGNFNRTLLLLRITNTLEQSLSSTAALSLITLFYIFRNITQTIGAYGMGALSDKLGRRGPLALCGFGLFGILALTLIYPTDNYLFLGTLFFISGLSAGTYTTLQKSIAADLLPENARGTGFGLLQTTQSIAELLFKHPRRFSMGFFFT